MAALPRRPLPVPPASTQYKNVQYRYDTPIDDIQEDSFIGSPFSSPNPYPSFMPQRILDYGNNTSALRGGTLLHKGFYDLLALIPSTPSASRFFWPTGEDPDLIAGPRYETIPNNPPPAPSPTSMPPATSVPSHSKNLKARRISKEMVSKPTEFM